MLEWKPTMHLRWWVHPNGYNYRLQQKWVSGHEEDWRSIETHRETPDPKIYTPVLNWIRGFPSWDWKEK